MCTKIKMTVDLETESKPKDLRYLKCQERTKQAINPFPWKDFDNTGNKYNLRYINMQGFIIHLTLLRYQMRSFSGRRSVCTTYSAARRQRENAGVRSLAPCL